MAGLEEGYQFKRAYNEKMAAFDTLASERLFFNQNGERASLTGQRKSDFLADTADTSDSAADEQPAADHESLNMVLLIQVPLKQKEPMRFGVAMDAGGGTAMDFCCLEAPSDVEEAVIGHGKVEGPFTEIDDLEIERDDRYPVRVTVQFYKATSNGVVSEQDTRRTCAVLIVLLLLGAPALAQAGKDKGRLTPVSFQRFSGP